MLTQAANRENRDRLDDRQLQLYQISLEHFLAVPFDDLVAEAARTGACTRLDLIQMGQRIYFDLARLARGELSSISVPRRLPRPGEFAAA